jgi:regulator of cell morphogenesis and NO signaling
MTDAVPIHDAIELTRYIETRYHTRHRKQLPMRLKLAEMVEDLHFSDKGVPNGLYRVLQRVTEDLEVHMKNEELVLFPAIRKGGGRAIAESIAAFRADHAEHDHQLAEIRRLTSNLAPPEGVCSSWNKLYAGLAEFDDDLREHIRLENDVLFPRFERAA